MDNRLLHLLSETRIREFTTEGGFDKVKGMGQPLARTGPDGLDGLEGLDPEARMDARSLKCCGGVPHEVVLAGRIQELERQRAVATPESLPELDRTLMKLRTELSILHERAGRNLAANSACSFVPG